MGIPVLLKEVAQELDGLFDEMTVYINRKTGETYMVGGEDMDMIEEEDEIEEEGLPDWQKESIAKAKEVVNDDTWVALPGKFEIHEWEIMRDFAESAGDEGLAGDLRRVIQGKGAFHNFQDVLERHGREEDWYRFKQEALEKIAAEALEAAGIPYEK